MLVVRVWGLPPSYADASFRRMYEAIVSGARCAVPDMVRDEKTEMTVLFPSSMLHHGPGENVFIEVLSSELDALDQEARDAFAFEMVNALKIFRTESKIECLILPCQQGYGYFGTTGNESQVNMINRKGLT